MDYNHRNPTITVCSLVPFNLLFIKREELWYDSPEVSFFRKEIGGVKCVIVWYKEISLCSGSMILIRLLFHMFIDLGFHC
jgi:hypothetical protein